MKLLKLEIENFRQYMGKQTIDFAAGDQNVTIVLGENGKGKTGIFRALMYGLYGSTHIQQDNKDDAVHLASLRLLDTQKGAVQTSVTVTFEHLGRKYMISRGLKALKIGSKIKESPAFVKLVINDKDGNYGEEVYEDSSIVNSKINDILDEDVKDFFLFDGEKIDTLAKTDAKVKKEVKNAIFKLLQINSLEEASDIISKLYKEEKDSIIKKSGSADLSSIEDKIANQEQEIEKDEKLKDALLEEVSAISSQIVELENKLLENEDIRQMQEKIQTLQQNLSDKTARLDDLKEQINGILKKDAPFLLFNSIFPNVTNYLEQLNVDKSSLVPVDVLEASIKDGVCACCNNDLKTHQENMQYVEALRENYRRSELVSMSSSIKNLISDKQNSYAESEESIIRLYAKLDKLKNERAEVIEAISIMKKEIGSRADAELHLEETQKSLKNLQERKQDTSVAIQHKMDIIENGEKNLKQLRTELAKMMKENHSLQFDNQVLSVMESIKGDVVKIASEFSSSMRHKLTELTTEIFKSIIDKKDIKLIEKVNINEKFELEIYSYEDVVITQDISQGQRQMVALAFITALAQIASGDDSVIDFPLFMDSPFNRLSLENRYQLIHNIPSLTSQWILLVTDTELTDKEKYKFDQFGRLGKFYKIVQNDVLDATITPVGLRDALTTGGL